MPKATPHLPYPALPCLFLFVRSEMEKGNGVEGEESCGLECQAVSDTLACLSVALPLQLFPSHKSLLSHPGCNEVVQP